MLLFGKARVGSKDEVREDCCYIRNIVPSFEEATTCPAQE